MTQEEYLAGAKRILANQSMHLRDFYEEMYRKGFSMAGISLAQEAKWIQGVIEVRVIPTCGTFIYLLNPYQ